MQKIIVRIVLYTSLFGLLTACSGQNQQTLPDTPTVPLLSQIDNYKIDVNLPSVSGTDSYDVFFHTADDFSASTQSGTAVTGNSHLITVSLDGTYYVWLVAKNDLGDSGSSPSASTAVVIPRLGDTGPGGGIVFYDDLTGFDFDENMTIENDEKNLFSGKTEMADKRFLEAALSDGATVRWGNSGPDIPNLPNMLDTFAPTLAASVGNGLRNTAEIIAYIGSNGQAAQEADTYTGGGLDDWFLPSMGELEILFVEKNTVGGFQSINYWSSSERSASFALSISFGSGSYTSSGKANTRPVRPVRAF